MNLQSAPPEPYATVTLQRGAQSDDSCIKCSASPSSSEYNAPVREPMNLCDVLPPPPDHPYGTYKPPTNMTIRTNPAAMSPQVSRRVPPTPPRWGTLPPPIPTFPHNWAPDNRPMMPPDVDNDQHIYAENDYESGSVLYEQCCRPEEPANYFMRGGEPTEEYYRNINMEFLEDQEFEPSTPPPPCPDTYTRNHANLRLLANNGQDSPSAHSKRTLRGNQQLTVSQQQQMQLQQLQLQQQQQQQMLHNGTTGSSTTQSVHSSDSESDNRWAPTRTRRSRSRSKSGDRKYLRTANHVR